MEGEKFLMAAGVTAAVVVGAFVFWGPSGSSVLNDFHSNIPNFQSVDEKACPLLCPIKTERRSFVM